MSNTQPILLLSDGHSSRTDYDMVMKQQLYIRSCHLLLMPANTSLALSTGKTLSPASTL